MNDDQTADADPNRVVPPAPSDAATPSSWTAPRIAPLAPPLSGAAPPLPPYAAGPSPAGPPAATPYPAASFPAPASPAPTYPAASYPGSQPALSNRRGVVLAAVGGAVVLSTIGIVAVVSLLLGAGRGTPTPAQPTSVAEDPGGAPSGVDSSGIADRLEAKMDEYRSLRDSGALWQRIPDNDFNRTALSAFLFFLTDMKVATIWGVDAEQAQEYDERMTMLEERFLAQQPLGDDIRITLEKQVFTYDGETGEGGFTPK